MDVELKPCPFCGGKAKLMHYKIKSDDWWYVACEACEVALDPLYFGEQDKEQAIERWNKRVRE